MQNKRPGLVAANCRALALFNQKELGRSRLIGLLGGGTRILYERPVIRDRASPEWFRKTIVFLNSRLTVFFRSKTAF